VVQTKKQKIKLHSGTLRKNYKASKFLSFGGGRGGKKKC
jgi:hypothetical protein